MTDENVEGASAGAEAPNGDETDVVQMPDEVTQQAEATDAPDGVADVENVPDEAAPEVDPTTADADETTAVPEPPEAEPATDEPESVPEAVGDGPAAGDPDSSEAPEEEPAGEADAAEAQVEEPAAAAAVAEPKRKKKRLPRPLRRQRPQVKRERPAERKPITRLPKPEHPRGRRQERQGTVVSAASDKTIVVRVDTVKVHPMYKKVIRRSTKLHAHDEGNQAKPGDIVRIVETRPLSKQKRWRLQEIVEAAK
jgi:small subunit ribosomal protein S17